jgi:TonB family protein
MLASLVLVFFGALAAQTPAAGSPPDQQPWPPAGVERAGDHIAHPRLLEHPNPNYTKEAMRAGIQGDVRMEAVVRADGLVGQVRVIESLDPGLDAEAVRTLRQWRFEPGRKDGVAVPVLVQIDMTFRLRDRRGEARAVPSPAPRVDPSAPWPPPGVVRPGYGIQSPRLVHETKPSYPRAAMRAGIEGMVWMEAVVGTNGRVSDVRVTQSLDQEHGLDEEAVRTVRQWRFAPGRRDGVAVPVVVEVQMSFALRK